MNELKDKDYLIVVGGTCECSCWNNDCGSFQKWGFAETIEECDDACGHYPWSRNSGNICKPVSTIGIIASSTVTAFTKLAGTFITAFLHVVVSKNHDKSHGQ